MIEVCDLSHSYGDHPVLNRVSFQVSSGKILGLVGVNGAGKSTLLRLMSGVLSPEAGQVLLDGINVKDPAARKELFFLPDTPYSGENTSTKSLIKFYRNFYPKLNEETFHAMCQAYQLPVDKPLRTYSKGMRRQTYLALAFAILPKYLLLDEAFDGLDPLARAKFKEQIRSICQDLDMTIVISSHSIKELEDFCDEYIALDGMNAFTGGQIKERSQSLCKFQIVFETVPDQSLFSALPMRSFKVTGRVAQVVFNGDASEIRPKIDELHPLLVDELEVSFDEAYIGNLLQEMNGGVFHE